MQAYIDELAQTLMEGADDPSTPAHARLVELISANVRPFLLPQEQAKLSPSSCQLTGYLPFLFSFSVCPCVRLTCMG